MVGIMKIMKNVDQINHTYHNLRPLPLVLSLVTWQNRPTLTCLHPPFKQLKRVRRSPLNLLLLRLNHSNSFSCSSPDLFSRPPTPFPFSGLTEAAQCPSCSERPKTEPSPLRCNLISAQHKGTVTALVLLATLLLTQARIPLVF